VDRDSCEFLRALVRPPGHCTPKEIEQQAGNVRNWDSLIELARQHRVLPTLFLRLGDMGPAVPPAVREQLQAEFHRNVFHNMASAAELIGVLKELDREGIPAMPFKGVVLGASAYGDLTRRGPGDLDVLIYYDHLERATAILLERGYQLKTPLLADGTQAFPYSHEYQFERQSDGMVLELRWRLELVQPRIRRDLGMDWVWARRRTAILLGAEVPNLAPETALLVLCLHASNHAWSRLVWICDVAQVLASSPDLDWKAATEEAKQLGLWRTLAMGVLIAHRVAGAEVPEAFLAGFEADGTASRLARHFEDNLFDAPGTLPPGHIPYNFLLLGFRDRVRMLLSLNFLRPNKRDRAAIHLPPSLDVLYYLVRPLRMLWDRSPRR
jgi:hypothetical protein